MPDRTQKAYSDHALGFDKLRNKTLFERDWLNRFRDLLPEGGSVLDIGCGSGEPISKFFIDQGYNLTGVDFADKLLDLARDRFPKAEWISADMRTLDMDRQFDGLIAWHSVFHLTPSQQIETLPGLLRHVKLGGVVMMTLGPEAVECSGVIAEGVEVYHASLSPEDYRELLEQSGLSVLEFVLNDKNCGGATIMLAQKKE